MKTGVQAVVSSLLGFILFGVLLFVPAGTFDYWQAWVFIAVFAAVSAVPSVYWILRKPEVVRRRMNAGPLAEARPAQKIASTAVFVVFAAVLAVSALDHRFGWSDVSLPVVVLGNVLVAIGLGVTMLVVEQNSYAAANVTVESGQKVRLTGLYGLVRHPMYFAVQILMAGTCLALASYWGTCRPHPLSGRVRLPHPR